MSHYLYLAVAGVCLAAFTSSRVHAAQGPAAKETPLPPPVFSLADLDRGVDPAQDFFQFANGGWNSRQPAARRLFPLGDVHAARQAQPAAHPQHPGGCRGTGRNQGRRAAERSPDRRAQDRRFLRQRHGYGRDQRRRHRAAPCGAGPDQCHRYAARRSSTKSRTCTRWAWTPSSASARCRTSRIRRR